MEMSDDKPQFSSDLSRISIGRLLYLAFVANIGSFLFGYDAGAMSSFLSSINSIAEDDTNTNDIYFRYIANNDGVYGFITAGATIGATFTYIMLLIFGNSLPKKDEIMLGAFFYFIGALFESEAGDATWHKSGGFSLFVMGRLLYGAGMALSFHSVPQYVSEHCPSIIRARVGSGTEAMIITGLFISYAIGYVYNGDYGWMISFRVAYIFATVMFVLTLFLPQSPRWMVRNNLPREEVLKVLQFVKSNSTLEDVIVYERSYEDEKVIKLKYDAEWTAGGSYSSDGLFSHKTLFGKLPIEVKVLFLNKAFRRCLFFAILMVFFMISTGQGAILYFASDIFGDLCGSENKELCILGLGIAKIVPGYIMIAAAEMYGRRTYMIVGSVTMCVGYLIFVAGYSVSGLALFGLYLSVVGYEVSYGVMMWVLITEIFPPIVRSAAIGISIGFFFFFATIFIFVVPYIESDLGVQGLFGFFFVFAVSGTICMVHTTPETKGVDMDVGYKLLNKRLVDAWPVCCDRQTDEEEESLIS